MTRTYNPDTGTYDEPPLVVRDADGGHWWWSQDRYWLLKASPVGYAAPPVEPLTVIIDAAGHNVEADQREAATWEHARFAQGQLRDQVATLTRERDQWEANEQEAYRELVEVEAKLVAAEQRVCRHDMGAGGDLAKLAEFATRGKNAWRSARKRARRAERACETLGGVIDRMVVDSLRFAGMEDQIDLDDPDQQTAWELLAELPAIKAERDQLRAELAEEKAGRLTWQERAEDQERQRERSQARLAEKNETIRDLQRQRDEAKGVGAVAAIRGAAGEARTRGDIGKPDCIEADTWLHWWADQISAGLRGVSGDLQ